MNRQRAAFELRRKVENQCHYFYVDTALCQDSDFATFLMYTPATPAHDVRADP